MKQMVVVIFKYFAESDSKLVANTSKRDGARQSVVTMRGPIPKQSSKRLSLPGNVLLQQTSLLLQTTSSSSDQPMSRRLRRASLVGSLFFS